MNTDIERLPMDVWKKILDFLSGVSSEDVMRIRAVDSTFPENTEHTFAKILQASAVDVSRVA